MRGKSFGAMNVLFLAGIQSMILPSMYNSFQIVSLSVQLSNNPSVFFLIMQFVPAQYTFAGAEYVVVPSVLCLMPFSCLWAGTISSANGQGCDEPSDKRLSIGRRASRVPFAKYFSSAKSNSAPDTAQNLSGATQTGRPHASPVSPTSPNHLDKLYPDLHEDGHIAVTQTYTVHSDKSSRHGSAV